MTPSDRSENAGDAPWRPMRVRPRRLVSFALLATVVGLAVVGGAAWLSRPGANARGSTTINDFGPAATARGWPFEVGPAWPGLYQWSKAEGPTWSRVRAWSDTQPITTHQAEVTTYGWPVPLLVERHAFCPRSDLPPGFMPIPPLQIRPVMPAFAIALAVVITAIGLPLVGGSAWRSIRRASRGQCIWCGYQCDALPVCPECGRDRRRSGERERGDSAAGVDAQPA